MIETVLSTVTIIIGLVITVSLLKNDNKENFTLVSPRPPAWFLPQDYKVTQWIVPLNQDRLSNIECLSYSRGNPTVLDINSSVYRMWRF
jgi:hypothetical protein